MRDVVRDLALVYVRRHPGRAAKVLESLSPSEAAALLEHAAPENAAGMMKAFPPRFACACFRKLSESSCRSMLVKMRTADAARLLRSLTEEERRNELGWLAAEEREPIERNLEFDEGSVGAIADPHALRLSSDWSVAEGVRFLRSQGRPVPSRLFLVDRAQKLLGAVAPADLLLADGDAALASLPRSSGGPVSARAPATALASTPGLTGPVAVLDDDGAFIGAVEEETLRALAVRDPAGSIAPPVVALGELYWLGLRDIFGGFDSGVRAGTPPEGGSHGG